MDETLSSLVEAAYGAALNDDLWDEWSRRAVAALGGVGGVFYVLDAENRDIERFMLFGRPENLIEPYESWWNQFDPQVPFVSGLARSTVYTSTDHVDLTRPEVAAYVDWQKREGGVDHHLGAAIVLEDGRSRAGLTIHRATEDGAFSREDRGRLETVLPHLQRAMNLGFRQSQLVDEAYWHGATDGQQDIAAVAIDERGRVTRTTPAAEVLLSRQNGLSVRHHRLVCADPVAMARLDHVIGEAIGSQPSSQAMSVRLASDGYVVVVAHPVPRAQRMLAPGAAAALVTLVARRRASASETDLWHRAFDLTKRERELASHLVAGHSLESAAAMLAISVNTARVHLRRVLQKTDTNRQAELINLLGRVK